MIRPQIQPLLIIKEERVQSGSFVEDQPGPEAAAGLLVLLSGERVSLVRWHHH